MAQWDHTELHSLRVHFTGGSCHNGRRTGIAASEAPMGGAADESLGEWPHVYGRHILPCKSTVSSVAQLVRANGC